MSIEDVNNKILEAFRTLGSTPLPPVAAPPTTEDWQKLKEYEKKALGEWEKKGTNLFSGLNFGAATRGIYVKELAHSIDENPSQAWNTLHNINAVSKEVGDFLIGRETGPIHNPNSDIGLVRAVENVNDTINNIGDAAVNLTENAKNLSAGIKNITDPGSGLLSTLLIGGVVFAAVIFLK